MDPADALFWYAQDAAPSLRPLIAGLFLLDRPAHWGRLRLAMENWLVALPRLRQRVVEPSFPLTLPEWEEDQNFDLDYHLRRVALTSATERALFDFVGEIFATPLDRLRPLWEAYAIEGLSGGKAAFFLKVHHCVMDCVGSIGGLEALTQRSRGERIQPATRVPAVRKPFAASSALQFGWNLATDGLVAGLELSRFVARAVAQPAETAETVARAARGVRGMITEMQSPGIHDPLADPGTGIGRRMDGVTFSLPRLRAIKDALQVSLNDVLLTAVAGMVGRYHRDRGIRIEALNCQVPMNLRHEQERYDLGNRVGIFNVILPIGERDVRKRLSRVVEQTSAAKRDRRGAAYPFLLYGLPLLPRFVMRQLANTITTRVNLICTNIPGPSEIRYLAGARIDALYPFAAVAVGVPLVIALLSYEKQLGVGIDTDPTAIPDPTVLHRHLETAITELEQLAGLAAPRQKTTTGGRAKAKRRPAKKR